MQEDPVESEKAETRLTYPKNLLPEIKSSPIENSSVDRIIDVPEEFDDPQKEAEDWIYQEKVMFYESKHDTAKRMSEEEDGLESAQWAMRASVARYKLEELKLNHSY